MTRTLLVAKRTSTPFDPDSISGLVLDINPALDPLGAVTSILDRKNGYVFNGTATRDATINGTPTYSGNGATNVLTSSAVISQLAGSSACTIIGVYRQLSVIVGSRVIAAMGTGGTLPGEALIYLQTAGSQIADYAFGNIGPTAEFYNDFIAVGTVWTMQLNFALASREFTPMRRNGTPVASSNAFNTDNSGVLASKVMSLLGLRGQQTACMAASGVSFGTTAHSPLVKCNRLSAHSD
jgi:hypothetical protein